MEAAKRSQAIRPPAPDCSPEVHATRTQDSPRLLDGQPGPGGENGPPRLAETQRELRARLASDHVGSRGQEGSSTPGPRPPGSQRRHAAHQRPHELHGRPNHAAVPQHQASVFPSQGGDACIHAGSLPAGDGCTESARVLGPAVSPVAVVCDWGSLTHGCAEALATGAAVAEAGHDKVRTLAFQNPNNYCYQHSFVVTWMWTMLHAHAAQGYRDLRTDCIGRGYQLMQQILPQQPCRLHHALAWGTYIQTWRRQQAQHDVGEFAMHMLRLLNPVCMRGEWQSRVQDPATRTLDTGGLNAPVGLHIPVHATTVQECVNAWHSQPAIHGFEATATTVIFQLGRFSHTTGGPVRKLAVRLAFGERVSLPLFADGLQTQWTSFDIVAGIYHLGARPTSGHYRAFLNGWDERGSTVNPRRPFAFPKDTFHTEDGVPAAPLDPNDVEILYNNIYLLWCVRTPLHLPQHPTTRSS